MTHPALENMNQHELRQLIDEATKLLAQKFPGEVAAEKPYVMEVEQAQGQQLDVTDVEQAADPFRSPTA